MRAYPASADTPASDSSSEYAVERPTFASLRGRPEGAAPRVRV